MNVVFMGTSAFAVPSLERLLTAHHPVLAVVTQPDRPRGRGLQVFPSPVKELALARRLPVLQPARARDPGFIAQLGALEPHLIVVVAYGQLLPPALLAIPGRGCVNVHASLLPKYRGAAPINWALIRGEVVTGVTIMLMEETLDTGPILLQASVAIDPHDNAQTLHDRLATLGADTLVEALEGLESGRLAPIPQDHRQATYAPKLRKEDGMLQWDRRAVELANLIRGVTPWPGAYTTHAGIPLKISRARAVPSPATTRAGVVARVDREGAWVETGDGYLLVEQVQAPGRRAMDVAAYARGHALHPGDVLG